MVDLPIVMLTFTRGYMSWKEVCRVTHRTHQTLAIIVNPKCPTVILALQFMEKVCSPNQIKTTIWVNYNNSLTRIKDIGDAFPQSKHDFQ